ncbi:unnamed protein product [Knipowitschia caucasica]
MEGLFSLVTVLSSRALKLRCDWSASLSVPWSMRVPSLHPSTRAPDASHPITLPQDQRLIPGCSVRAWPPPRGCSLERDSDDVAP